MYIHIIHCCLTYGFFYSIYARDKYVSSAHIDLSVLICSGCYGNGKCDYGTPDIREVSCHCFVGWEGI